MGLLLGLVNIFFIIGEAVKGLQSFKTAHSDSLAYQIIREKITETIMTVGAKVLYNTPQIGFVIRIITVMAVLGPNIELSVTLVPTATRHDL